MSTKFRDVLQCIDGIHKGLIAQILNVDNGEVGMFHRSFDGTPNFFEISAVDCESYWRLIGTARIGPKPNTLEPENATRPAERPEDSSPSPIAPPVPSSPLAPLKLDELMNPLPFDVKAVPIGDTPDTPVWPKPEPEPTREEAKAVKRRAKKRRRASNPIPSKSYTALVSNGAGDKATVTYALRVGLDPRRFIAGAIVKARQVIPDVKPWSVAEIKEGA